MPAMIACSKDGNQVSTSRSIKTTLESGYAAMSSGPKQLAGRSVTAETWPSSLSQKAASSLMEVSPKY